jgi:hypothetical protein
MSYKFTRGSVERGDIYNEDDVQQNTYIDFSEDAIGLMVGGVRGLIVSGSGAVSSSLNMSASAFYGDGSGLSNVSATTSPAGSSGEVQFNNNGSMAGADNLFFDNTNKRVGIGTAEPAYRLEVAGNLGVQGYIYHSGDANTYIRFQPDDIVLQAGGKGMIKMDEGNLRITVNTGSNNIDFIIKDGSGQELLTTKGSKGHLGIHNDSPGSEFVVGQDTLVVSGSSVGIGSSPWSGKELHITDGDSSTSGAPTDSQVVVESGGNAGISLLAGGTRARIYFGDSSDIDEGIIEYKFTNNERYNITVGANEVMRIYESGYSNTITTLNGVKTTAGLFTEGHPYYSNDANITVGDCCVLENGQIVRSSSPMQKNVGGIAWYSVLDDLQNPGSSGDDAWPLTLNDGTVSRVAEDALGVQCNMAEESGGEWVPTAKFQTLWKLAAVGDSRQSNYGTTALTGFKVCNEGGDISVGDLLCTSTTPGFLMKQSDDIMRSYTVGKAMEDVTFDSGGQATGIYGYVYCG